MTLRLPLPEIVCNTSPIRYLHQLGVLDAVPALLGSIVVPQAVADELTVGRALGIAVPDVFSLKWIEVRSPRSAPALRLVRDLDAGEAGVLALALETPGTVVLLDDRLARRVADSLSIPMRGTVGLLVDFKKRGFVSRVTPLLDELDRLGFRLSQRTREVILRTAGEE